MTSQIPILSFTFQQNHKHVFRK
uniref:Uncharacterized protein n=1 Tax=Anguilla anguilla TaxID=7936 RepID=A0A0E9UGY2_ANGAN